MSPVKMKKSSVSLACTNTSPAGSLWENEARFVNKSKERLYVRRQGREES